MQLNIDISRFMRPRQGIIETFSTFLQFDAERPTGWATDAKLRRSMQSRLAQLPQPSTSENFWALYWYGVWQSPVASLAREHLAAYLQETCYWAAQKTIASFVSEQYTLSDCFQIAIASLDKVLKGFNPNQGYELKKYGSAIFSSAIRESLRQRQEVDICTPWALLRKLSQKRLAESLQTTGLSSETIASYVLAWNCFKTIYVPTQATATRQLPKPDSATWSAIANLYNTQRYAQVSATAPECRAELLEQWLLACTKAIRSYLYPSVISIHAPTIGQDSGELLDELPESFRESLLTQVIEREEERNRAAKLAEVSAVLTAALAELDSQAQMLLQLYYGQGLTQQQMAQQLEIKQYTVSRRLTKSRELLLLALARWSEQTLHISLSSSVLKDTSIVLEEWLGVRYSQPDLRS
jgi:RNA polymerase sigma factor (sigma-70 family)